MWTILDVDVDPGSGTLLTRDSGFGMEKVGSGIPYYPVSRSDTNFEWGSLLKYAFLYLIASGFWNTLFNWWLKILTWFQGWDRSRAVSKAVSTLLPLTGIPYSGTMAGVWRGRRIRPLARPRQAYRQGCPFRYSLFLYSLFFKFLATPKK